MMTRRLVRIALLAAVAAAALVASGCGNKHAVVTVGDTEGVWIDAGRLDFHVQGSRVLEPALVPDKAYLEGLPANVSKPTGSEVWFAVFLRIENRTNEAAQTPRQFEIVDTTGRRFTPYEMQPSNPFAYRPVVLEPNQVIPTPDSAQDFNSFSGAMLLFKLPLESYANRPLEFKVHSADGAEPTEASVNLDV
jgi:hypothetical protein